MPSSFADRCKETSTTTGSSDFTLAGAVTGYQTLNNGIGVNLNIEYMIEAVDANGVPTGDWEVGDGFLTGSTTLRRDLVRASSNGGALVNFSAGTKNVECVFSANECRWAPRSYNLQYGMP